MALSGDDAQCERGDGSLLNPRMPSANVVICGGGNGAHALIALAKNVPGVTVSVLTVQPEVEKLQAALGDSGTIRAFWTDPATGPAEVCGRPDKVVSDASEVIPDADMVVLVLPAFVHQSLLKDMAPYLKPGTSIVGMPGQAGFEFLVKEELGDELYKKTTLITLASLPWACRINEFGKEVNILGRKAALDGAAHISPETRQDLPPVQFLEDLLGGKPKLHCDSPLIRFSLQNINAMLHPAVSYGRFKDWDGTPLDESPLFYQGMTQEAADRMEACQNEMLAIAQSLGVKISTVSEILKDSYGAQIVDDSSLFNVITKNTGYNGLTHPVKATGDGKVVPDWGHRYMMEDIPNGLAVIKGFGELSGVKTPVLDEILKWCQEKIGHEYISPSGKFDGKDVAKTRAPQRYGITSKDQLLKFYARQL